MIGFLRATSCGPNIAEVAVSRFSVVLSSGRVRQAGTSQMLKIIN